MRSFPTALAAIEIELSAGAGRLRPRIRRTAAAAAAKSGLIADRQPLAALMAMSEEERIALFS